MKPVKLTSKENKVVGRFATPEEAAQAKNADLITSLKKLNLKVVANKSIAQQVK